MKARSHLSIGEVLSLLQDEFPDITISKIRFLESQGLLDPERTPSGYRKFYDADLHQLRYILIQQRDHFLPLKVIKDRIASGQHLPAPGEDVADLEGVELEGRSGPGPGRNGSDPAGPPAAGLPDGAPEATDGPGSGAAPMAGVGPAGGASPSASAPTAASAGAPAAAEAGAPGAAGDPMASMAPAAGAGPGAGSGAGEPAAGVPASADVDGSEANGLTAGGVDPAAWSPESTGPTSDSAGRERPGTAAGAGAGTATAGAGGTAAATDTPPWASRGTAAGGPGAAGPGAGGAGGGGGAERAQRAGAAEASGREPVAGPGRAGPEPEAPAIAAAAAGAADRGGAEPAAEGTDPAGSGEVDQAAPGVEAASGAATRRPGAAAGTDRDEGARARRGRATSAAAGERAGTVSSPGRGGDLTSASLSLTELAGAAGLDVSELRDLERYGVVSGRRVGADTVYGDDALQAAQVAARFRRHGIEARHLRAYRMAADREIGLFEQVVAPQLRSRRDGPGAGPAETLDELEELGDALRHVLVRQALQGLLDGG